MVPSIGKKIAQLVISLAIMVISLPVITFAASVPLVTALNPVSQGIRTPVKVAQDAAGNYYVTDPGSGGVLKYNPYGKQTQVIKTAGIPQGVAVAMNGNLLVSQGDFVAELNNNGNEVRRLGSGAGQFKFANGIAVDSAGFEYVVDSADNSVQVFNASGVYATRISTWTVGATADSFSLPTGIAYEKVSDQIAVVDTLNGRVLFFNSASGSSANGGPYAYKKTIGGPLVGSGPLKFTVPQGVTFEYSKDATPVLARMYVVDTFQSTVQAIDPTTTTGTFLRFIGDYGTANGQLIVPSDVVFDQGNGRLVVVNGFGNLTQYGIDGGKNPTSADVTPPALTIDPVLTNVSVPSITVTGTREAGATVAVRVDTVAVAGAVTYPQATTWSCQITGLMTGANNINVQARDAAGNLTSLSTVVFYTPPPANFTVNSWPEITKTTPYVFTGTMASGATVTVNPVATCTYPTSTTWSCPVPLAEGANTVTFTVAKTGFPNGTMSVPVKLDTTPPVLVISAVADLSNTSAQVQNVTGKVSDANLDTVTVAVNGKPAQAVGVTNGVFSFPVLLDNAANPANPANTVTVVATDKVGNSTTNSRTINFDVSKVGITVNAPADGANIKSTSVLPISGSVSRTVSALKLYVNNSSVPINVTPDVSNAWSATVNLAAGLNDIQIEATEGAVTSRVKRTVFYDGTSPELAVNVSNQDKATNLASFNVQGAFDSSVTSLTAAVNGVARTLSPSGGTFNFNVDFSQEGPYSVVLSAVDAAGKTSVSTRSFVYDVTPPALTVTAPTVIPTSSLSGTVEPGAAVLVKDAVTNSPVGVVSVTNNAWSVNLGTSYSQTDLFKLMVSATDVAGNTIVKSVMKPDGDLNGDGSVTPGDPKLLDDARLCLNIVVGTVPVTPIYLAHGDIGPLLNGQPNPNGKIDLVDCVLIQRKAGNLPPIWW